MAEEDDREIHLSGQKARAGSTPRMTRYILGVSLALIIVVFAIMYLWNAG